MLIALQCTSPIVQLIKHKGCNSAHLVLQVDYVNKEVVALVDEERGNQETYKFEDIILWIYKTPGHE